jgi:hypothetical protein
MKINKPDWVSHENSPVYSIHVRPNENRLATGGAGAIPTSLHHSTNEATRCKFPADFP